jgi:CheY-like chemotaxis protein
VFEYTAIPTAFAPFAWQSNIPIFGVMTNKRLVLMLEYDEDDQFITRQYFRNYSDEIDLTIVNSSEEVLSYLKEAKLSRRKMPSLLLLNYNSTPLNAAELLDEVKSDKQLRHIPAVVLSGTIIPRVVADCYSHGASSFIQKPALVEEIDQTIGSFIQYWFRTVELA